MVATQTEHGKMSAPQIVISLKSRAEPPAPALRDRLSPYQMIDVDQAMDHILREAGNLSSSTELVPMNQLKNLMGRALAVDLKSNVNIPPFQVFEVGHFFLVFPVSYCERVPDCELMSASLSSGFN